MTLYINEDMRKEEKDKRDVVGIFQRRGERRGMRRESRDVAREWELSLDEYYSLTPKH